MKKVVSAFVFLSAFLFSLIKVRDYDLFIYLRLSDFESIFSPLKRNFFSFSYPDYPYNNYSILYSEIVSFFHSLTGFDSLILFQAVVVTISFLIIYLTFDEKKSSAWLTLAIFLLSLFTLRYRLLFRPHNLTYLFFAINLFLLYRLPKNASIFLFINQILWVNSHIGFILGIVNLFLLIPLKPELKRSFLKLIVSLIAGSLLSIYGIKPFFEVLNPFFGATKDIFKFIEVHEWQPSDQKIYLSFYGTLIVFTLFLFINFKGYKVIPFYLFYLMLSVRFVRFIDFFALSAFFATLYISEIWEMKKIFRFFQIPIFTIIFLFCSLDYMKNINIPKGFGLASYFYPSGAINFIKKNSISGNCFNYYAAGANIIKDLYPQVKPIMDGRLCYPLDFIALYAKSFKDKEAFSKIMKQFDIDIILMDFDHPEILLFLEEIRDQYPLVYFDNNSMIFLKRDKKFEELIKKYEIKEISPVYVSGYKESGDINKIEQEMQKLLNINPSNRLFVMYGNLLFQKGNIDEALNYFYRVVESSDPNAKAEAYNNIGVIRLNEGKFKEAKGLFRKALDFADIPYGALNLFLINFEEKNYLRAYYYLKKYESFNGEITEELSYKAEFLKKYVKIVLTILIVSAIFLIFLKKWSKRKFSH